MLDREASSRPVVEVTISVCDEVFSGNRVSYQSLLGWEQEAVRCVMCETQL